MLLGSIDVPGGFRFKPPFPKPIPPAQKPTGRADQVCAQQGDGRGPPLGFPTGPEDLLSSPTARRAASTRRSRGRRRSPPTA